MLVLLLLHKHQQLLIQLLQQHQQLEQELGEELGEGLQLQLLGVVLLEVLVEVLVEVLHQVLGEVLGEGEVHSLPQGNLVPPHLLLPLHLLLLHLLVVETEDGEPTSMQVVTTKWHMCHVMFKTRYFMCVLASYGTM